MSELIKKMIIPSGLCTDPGPFTTAPAGALTKAKNVVIENGYVKPRPGLRMYSDSNLFGSYYTRHGAYVEGVGEFVWAWNDYGTTWSMRRDRTDTITGPSNFTAVLRESGKEERAQSIKQQANEYIAQNITNMTPRVLNEPPLMINRNSFLRSGGSYG